MAKGVKLTQWKTRDPVCGSFRFPDSKALSPKMMDSPLGVQREKPQASPEPDGRPASGHRAAPEDDLSEGWSRICADRRTLEQKAMETWKQ